MSNDPDNRSLTLLYQQHRSELLAFLTRRVRCRETARDLLQDAFVRLMHSERGEIGNLRAFLYRIANNLSIDHARRSQVRGVNDDQALDQLLNETSPERSAVAGNTLDHLERLIDCLPSPTREVFLLARVEQLSYKDIAARLGLDPRAVERHLTKP
ncbi:RNA polymerase sigma factor [Pseudomonas sp.]|uniref:RNA polymerase sigma factor n=1 Tax=Pseudomonas sp. TaxID=306 RepID=UPI002FC6FB12